MKREFDINQLAAMKPQFIAWMEAHWCSCRELHARDLANLPTHDPTNEYWTDAEHKLPDGSPCNCYGRDEFDDVYLATIDDDAAIIHYGDRTLTLDFTGDDAGEPFITCGTLQWVGDDCDYYGAIVHWLASLR